MPKVIEYDLNNSSSASRTHNYDANVCAHRSINSRGDAAVLKVKASRKAAHLCEHFTRAFYVVSHGWRCFPTLLIARFFLLRVEYIHIRSAGERERERERERDKYFAQTHQVSSCMRRAAHPVRRGRFISFDWIASRVDSMRVSLASIIAAKRRSAQYRQLLSTPTWNCNSRWVHDDRLVS
jgi:hypothetical protein